MSEEVEEVLELEVKRDPTTTNNDDTNDDLLDTPVGDIRTHDLMAAVNVRSKTNLNNIELGDYPCSCFDHYCKSFYPCYQVKWQLWIYHCTHQIIGWSNFFCVLTYFLFLFNNPDAVANRYGT